MSDNVTEIQASNCLNLIEGLEDQLRVYVRATIGASGYGTLLRDLRQSVERQYHDVWQLVDTGQKRFEEIEIEIDRFCPQLQEIRDFVEGQAGLRLELINTLCNFYRVKYEVTNFNPAMVYLLSQY